MEQQADPSLPIAYLEHLIHDSRIGEIDSVFHNALIKLYLGRVRDLYADYLMTLPPGMVHLEEVALPSALLFWRGGASLALCPLLPSSSRRGRGCRAFCLPRLDREEVRASPLHSAFLYCLCIVSDREGKRSTLRVPDLYMI